MWGFVKANGAKHEYVKPHGGLYNDMMKDVRIFKAVLSAIKRIDIDLKVMVLSMMDMKAHEEPAAQEGITLLYEVFADRAYDDEGYLVPRHQTGSVLHDVDAVVARLKLLQNEGVL